MHPILIRIGSFQLPTFGVLLAAAIVLAVYTIVRLGRREGLDTGRLVDFSTWLLVVGVVGAKVLMIVTDWRTYWDHPGGLFSWATLQAAGVFTSAYSHEVTGVPLGVHVHPTQLYESLAELAIFAILLWRYRRKSRDGEIFLLYLALYAVARFFLEFLRGDEDRGFVFHHLLSTSQFIAILALAAAGGLALHFWSGPRKAPQTATALPAASRVRG